MRTINISKRIRGLMGGCAGRLLLAGMRWKLKHPEAFILVKRILNRLPWVNARLRSMMARQSAAPAYRKRYRGIGSKMEVSMNEIASHKRFISDCSAEFYEKHVQTAKEYTNMVVAENGEPALQWSYQKPFDDKPSSNAMYELQYAFLNLLQAMKVRQFGKVLEVGCGPGWITEVLMLLGFQVYALDPSEKFIEIAKERVLAARQHHRNETAPVPQFMCTTIEECDIPDGQLDAIIFFDSLHHTIQEELVFARCSRMLRAGGVLGISEGAWVPGDKEQEKMFLREMEKYGALENPFTTDYLNYLLTANSYEWIRFYSVNGLFPLHDGDKRLRDIGIPSDPKWSNTVVAVYTGGVLSSRSNPSETTGTIKLTDCTFDEGNREYHLALQLTNTGKTIWLNDANFGNGFVTIAFFQKGANANLLECPRKIISETVMPGQTLNESAVFKVPSGFPIRGWNVTLINEGLFWFSDRGMPDVAV